MFSIFNISQLGQFYVTYLVVQSPLDLSQLHNKYPPKVAEVAKVSVFTKRDSLYLRWFCGGDTPGFSSLFIIIFHRKYIERLSSTKQKISFVLARQLVLKTEAATAAFALRLRTSSNIIGRAAGGKHIWRILTSCYRIYFVGPSTKHRESHTSNTFTDDIRSHQPSEAGSSGTLFRGAT